MVRRHIGSDIRAGINEPIDYLRAILRMPDPTNGICERRIDAGEHLVLTHFPVALTREKRHDGGAQAAKVGHWRSADEWRLFAPAETDRNAHCRIPSRTLGSSSVAKGRLALRSSIRAAEVQGSSPVRASQGLKLLRRHLPPVRHWARDAVLLEIVEDGLMRCLLAQSSPMT